MRAVSASGATDRSTGTGAIPGRRVVSTVLAGVMYAWFRLNRLVFSGSRRRRTGQTWAYNLRARQPDLSTLARTSAAGFRRALITPKSVSILYPFSGLLASLPQRPRETNTS